MKKRLLSAFMALALCLTLLPTAALAAETEGTVQTPPAVEKAADPANREEQQENQPAAPKQENQSAEQEEQQEDSAAKQAVAAVQALIDALPAVDELDGMDDDDAMAVYEAFQAACDAYYDTLTEEQQAQLKNTEKLAALSDWFNAQVAPLENSGDIYPDTVDADGGITAGTSFSRNGPIVEDSEDSTTFYDNQYYVVKESSNVTINGDLIIDSCINNGLILCKGATLTVTGALIHKGGTFPIYGVSDSGQNAGRLVIKNSSGSGAAIRATGNNAQLGISSGELELHDGGSGKLVDGVNLSSTNHIHKGTRDGTAVSPEVWGAVSLEGKTLTLAYCTHDNATYVSANQTQHTKHCPDCGFAGTAVACGNNGSEGSVSVGDGGHRQKCPCGNTFGDVIPHTVETVPTHSKEHHVSGCQYCDYTSGSPETHEWDSTTGECTKCHFKPIAQGTWLSIHDSLQEAMDEASEITGAKALVTLYSEASGNTAIDDEFEFNYPGKTITLDMAGYSLEHQGNPIITVEAGTLIVKGTATITKKADSPEQVNSAIVVKGGELIFEGAVTATGGKYSNKVASAIEVSGGKLTFNDEVNAKAESIDTAQPSGYMLAPAINVTGGEVTFAQKLTATGGIFKDGTNLSKQEPAVYATSGTLDFKGDLDLNGGLTLTKSAKLANLLTQGTFSVSAGTGSSPLSVKGSSVYKKVSDLLAEGYACVKTDSLAEGKEKEYANTRAYTCSDNVTIVKHEHEWKLDSQYPHLHSCACGKSENHEYDSSTGKCKICQSECSHKDVDNDGTCFTCKAQMLVKIENGGNTTYSTDFKAAMNAAENGTTVTLLADVSILGRTGISGDNTTVTLDLNGHKITSGWLDVGGKDTNGTYTACTLKIIGKGSYEPPMYGGIITVDMKATLDLSEWEGGTISSINISDSSNYEAATREAAVIVGPKAGTIGKLSFGNNQLDELKKTKLSGGSFNEIWVADFGPVKLGELLADGYAYQNADGSYVEYGTKLQGASIFNVKVVKCLHPGMKPGGDGVATCEYCGKNGKFVASVDGNLYTADQWKDAFKAWLGDAEDENANGILKLYTDYEAEAADAMWSVGYRPNNNTLDLNGHKMSVQGDGAFKPTHNMHLTVTDGTDRGQIENILLDGSQGGSFTLESGFVGNLEMTGGAVVALEGGSVDKLDVQNSSANTKLSIQGGSLGELNIKDWADGMHVSATGGSLGAYNLPSGKILADVLDHQYYAEGTSLDKRVDAVAQKWEKFDIKQAPYDFGSTSKAAAVPINGSIPFTVDSPNGDEVGLYDVKWYRRTDSGAEHMTENRVAGVNVNDTLDVFCVITGVDRPGGAMQWQVAVKGYTINVVPAKLNGGQTVITQKPGTGNTGNPADNRLVVTPFSTTLSDVEYKFEVTYNGRPLELNKDYTIKDSSNRAKNAGRHTLTIEGMGNYTGEKSVTWTLEPYELSVENFCHVQIYKMYDGTDAVTDSTNGINGLNTFSLDSNNPRNPILSAVDNFNLDKSDYQLSNMKFDSAEAGDRTFTGTMTLTSGGNFVFAGGSRVMQIEYGSSGSVAVFIGSASIAAPAAKALQVANNHAATYTVDLSALLPALEAPREYGALTYGAPTVNLSSGYYTDGARVEDGKLILPIQAVKTDTTGNIGSVEVKVSTTNYHDFTLTINVIAKNRLTPVMDGKITASKITYGQALSDSSITGKMKDPNTGDEVKGTFSWKQPGDTILDASTLGHSVEWTFTPTDENTYTEATGTATVKVDKAQQYGKVSMAGYTYGQTPSTPTLTDRAGDGRVTYYYNTTNSNSGGTKWENIQADTLNAGTYYMYAELGETENYGSFTAACVQFRVVKAMPTCTKPTGLTAIYGQTLEDVTLPDGWSWMNSSESVGDASTVTKTFQAKFTPKDTENYNTVENIELEVMVNKADGRNLKTVELEQKYTDTSEHTYTPDWAGLPAGQGWTFSSEATIVLPKQDFAADGNLLTYAISGGKVGDKITITIKASCDNYEDFTITLNVTLTEKDDQKALRITGGTTVVYGQTLQLGTSGGSGSGAVTYTVTNGTGEATIDATGKLTPVKVGKVKVSATKAGDASYNSITSSPVEITITRATPTGEPAYTKITASGKTLADAALGIGTITPAGGTIAWDDPTTTEVVANKSYGWTYTPTDTNYTTLTGSIQLWHKSTSSGGGSYYVPTVPDMPMLYRGCTGDAVKTLQDKLNTLGYNSGNVDGIFGAKTYAAVTAFQKANSLGVDGIVGKLTWAKLYDATPVNVTPVTPQPMLRTGSRGDAVRKLQELLNAKGYTCGNVDGIFGSKTYAAVLAFQKANGLAADGIVGPLTWGKLV